MASMILMEGTFQCFVSVAQTEEPFSQMLSVGKRWIDEYIDILNSILTYTKLYIILFVSCYIFETTLQSSPNRDGFHLHSPSYLYTVCNWVDREWSCRWLDFTIDFHQCHVSACMP